MDLTKTYLENPNTCPYCGSVDLEAGTIQLEDTEGARDIYCKECGNEWTDLYELVSVDFKD